MRNLAIDIFSCSFEPLTSAKAVNLMAGGPVGMSIKQNHSIGSSPRSFVFVARVQMRGMLMLDEPRPESAVDLPPRGEETLTAAT